MAKQNLLLVDADLRSLRVLEVSLRKAGYNVASIGTARDALAMLEQSRPDLVLCDTRLPGMDGFELIQEIRKRPDLADVPLMILSSDVSVETKVRGLQLGVEDYLTKPIYIKELLARVGIVLQRKRREGIEQLEHGNKRRFSGALADMGVVDLLQAVDHNKKSGVLYLKSAGSEGAIYFCNGAPVDAVVGSLHGTRAIYRTLLWTDGTFEIDFREIDREDHVQTGMQALLMEGLRRVDEWGRLLEQLPDMDTVFEVSETQLFSRLAEIPDQINSVLREFDGRRSLWQILDACNGDDLETLNAVSKLYFEGLLYNTGRHGNDPLPKQHELDPEPSDIVLPHISSGPPVITHTLAPAWPSVPTGDDSQTWTRVDEDTFQLNIPSTPRVPEETVASLSQPPRRRKGRKRKRRASHSIAADAKHAARQADETDVHEVDESVAELTPITVSPPPSAAAAEPKTSVPPPLPTTSRPAKPTSWPDEHITSEVSLSQFTDAGSDASGSEAEVLTEQPARTTAAPPLDAPPTAPPPLPALSTRPPQADPADFTLVPGKPTAHIETARPLGIQTQPPLSAASSAPPGPTTLRPEGTAYRDTAQGLQPTAAESQRAPSEPVPARPSLAAQNASEPPLDAEAAPDLALTESDAPAASTPPPLAAERRSLAEPPPLIAATEPPLDAEAVPDLSFTELPAVASPTPPPLPFDSVPLAHASQPAASEPTPSDIPVVTQSYAYSDVSPSSTPPRTANAESTRLPSLRVSNAPANSSDPLDYDAAAAKLGSSMKKRATESIAPVVSIKPSLRQEGMPPIAASQPATTAKPPPFTAVTSMSQSPSPRAGHAPQYRTDTPPPFSLEAANDNASPPAAEQSEPDTAMSEREGGELSAFAKVALAQDSMPPQADAPAAAPEVSTADAMSSSHLLSAALLASSESFAGAEPADPVVAEAPASAQPAPPIAASVPAPSTLSQMPTGETAAVAEPAPPEVANTPAPETLSQMPTGEVLAAAPERSAAPQTPSDDVWSARSKAPSTAAPVAKPRSKRWMQVGSVAAAAALAAGLYALRARDAVPQGSLIRAVPNAEVIAKAPEPVEKPAAPAAPAPAAAQHIDETGEPKLPEAKANAEPAQQPQAAEPAAPTAEAVEEVEAMPEPQPSAAKPPEKAPETPKPAPPAVDTKEMLAKGRSLEQKGRKKDALALYEKLVADGGGSSQLQSHMAFMYLNQGNNAKAEEHALKASAADETNSEAWIVLGAARSSLGKKQAADEAYRNCATKGQGQYVTECRRMLR